MNIFETVHALERLKALLCKGNENEARTIQNWLVNSHAASNKQGIPYDDKPESSLLLSTLTNYVLILRQDIKLSEASYSSECSNVKRQTKRTANELNLYGNEKFD